MFKSLVAVLFVAAMLILKSPRMYTSGLFERPCKVFLSVSKLALWFSLGGLYIFRIYKVFHWKITFVFHFKKNWALIIQLWSSICL